MDKKKALILIGCTCVLAVMIAISYAYWLSTRTQTEKNIVTTGCLSISLKNEQNDINLNDAYPVNDDYAKTLVPYTFTLKNECDSDTNYRINLENLEGTTLNDRYVGVIFNGAEPVLLNSYKLVTPELENTISARKLEAGTLTGKESKDYSLILYISGKEANDSNSMNKLFEAKIAVTSSPESTAYICKKATELHTEMCQNSGCNYRGYNDYEGIDITYGSIPNGENYVIGDAYDCDIDGDGEYSSENERFYYVSNDGNYMSLIYSHNVANGTIVMDTYNTVAYDETPMDYRGPYTAKTLLPTTEDWPNIPFDNNVRDIYDESGTLRVSGFSYEGYAARLLTYNEYRAACADDPSTTSYNINMARKCSFLAENSLFSKSTGPYGYWLESSFSPTASYAFSLSFTNGYISPNSGTSNNGGGVRPVIEVPIDKVEK